jgi:hypothetical protein
MKAVGKNEKVYSYQCQCWVHFGFRLEFGRTIKLDHSWLHYVGRVIGQDVNVSNVRIKVKKGRLCVGYIAIDGE